MDKSAAPNRNICYQQVPSSIPAETPRTQIHMDFDADIGVGTTLVLAKIMLRLLTKKCFWPQNLLKFARLLCATEDSRLIHQGV
jgi:hypothetical protein